MPDRTGDVVVDLGDATDVRRAADVVLDRYGRCDVLVHSAAMVAFAPFEAYDLEVWRQVQAVNVGGPSRWCRRRSVWRLNHAGRR